MTSGKKYLLEITTESYPASRAYIFALLWARRVRSYARIWREGMRESSIMVSVHSLTQDSQDVLNRSRTGKTRFFDLFVQMTGRIWTVVRRGYFSHAISYRENVAPARRVQRVGKHNQSEGEENVNITL